MDLNSIKLLVLVIMYLNVTGCLCLQKKTGKKSDIRSTNKDNITLNINETHSDNISYDIIQLKYNDTLKVNVTMNKKGDKKVTETERQTASRESEQDEPLPIPIMVASPAVAVAVFVFICVAYKWHATQLDAQARELASKLGTVECPSPCVPCSPCRNTQRLLPPSQSMQVNFPCHSDSALDLLGAKRKNSRSPSPILLSPPHGFGSHRGSSWSAFSDQEVISHHSPRRHSTVLL